MKRNHVSGGRIIRSVTRYVINLYSVLSLPPVLPQNGTEVDDELLGAAIVDDDKSVVVAGHTWGDFTGSPQGFYDFIAIKLDVTNGTEIWRYQVQPDELACRSRDWHPCVKYVCVFFNIRWARKSRHLC